MGRRHVCRQDSPACTLCDVCRAQVWGANLGDHVPGVLFLCRELLP